MFMLQSGMSRLGLNFLILMGLCMAMPCAADEVFGAHYGYTFDVETEKNKREVEMVMLARPPDPPKHVGEGIVNEKLSREFKQQYEYRFGQTTAEQVLNSPGRTDEYVYYTGQNVGIVEYTKYQRQFAEYMGRRLVEYHVDQWFKTDPTLRPIYELKDKLSNLDVQVKKGYKIKFKYNFAGPSFDATVDNPYDVDARVHMDMSGIVSSPVELIYSLGGQVSSRIHVAALYKQIDGIYQLVLTRRMTRQISTSITGSIDALAAGPTVQQNLVLVGFSWSE